MKKKFRAVMAFLQSINPLTDKAGEGLKPRTTRKDAKRKGFYVQNPKGPLNIAEIESLVADWKPHWVVEHNVNPRQDKATGKWFPPSLFIGQPFDEPSEDELFEECQDW